MARRVLAVVGSAPERWDDLEAFWALDVPHDVCCINRVGIEFPCDFKFWFSYHSTELREWAAQRPDVTAALVTTGRHNDGVKRLLLHDTSGSSSLQAARVARRYLGYNRVIMCGVPLTGCYKNQFFRHWARSYEQILPYVRSMSGNTRVLLGEPTRKWLGGPG